MLNSDGWQKFNKKKKKQTLNREEHEGQGSQGRDNRRTRHQIGDVKEVPDPHPKNTHNEDMKRMKNYELRWHFSLAVGAQETPGLEHRIKRLTQAGITPPGNKELSARNT